MATFTIRCTQEEALTLKTMAMENKTTVQGLMLGAPFAVDYILKNLSEAFVDDVQLNGVLRTKIESLIQAIRYHAFEKIANKNTRKASEETILRWLEEQTITKPIVQAVIAQAINKGTITNVDGFIAFINTVWLIDQLRDKPVPASEPVETQGSGPSGNPGTDPSKDEMPVGS